MTSNELIEDLIRRTNRIIEEVTLFKELPISDLNYRQAQNKWSIIECIEHLNLYGKFYLPEISDRIKKAKHGAATTFKSGWLGDYFAKSMLPAKSGKLAKMNTFKEMNPIGKHLDISVLTTFLEQQQQLVNLLNEAREVSLSKTRTSISISKWITLRLGDTLRVVIYHNQRHVLQAQEILNMK